MAKNDAKALDAYAEERAAINAVEAEPVAMDPEQARREHYAKIYPLHIVDGQIKVLVARYRKQIPSGLSEQFTYIGGPIRDSHPLNIARVRAKLLNLIGETVYLDPERVDSITFEDIPDTPDNAKAEEELAYERQAELIQRDQGNPW